jgi:hypothetical protein
MLMGGRGARTRTDPQTDPAAEPFPIVVIITGTALAMQTADGKGSLQASPQSLNRATQAAAFEGKWSPSLPILHRHQRYSLGAEL